MKLKLTLSFFVAVATLFIGQQLYAQEQITTKELPAIARSVEAMGMGGAYFGKSDSKYSVFYNPAGIARVKKSSVDIFPLTVGMNTNAIRNIPTVITSLTNTNDVNVGVSKLINTIMLQHTNITPVIFFPAYTSNRFTFGLISSTDVSIVAYNQVLPEVALRIKSDNGLTFGMAETFLDNDALAVGISFKGLMRMNANITYSSIRLTNAITNNTFFNDITSMIFGDGMGFAFLASVGAMYNLPFLDAIKPRVAASVNDVGFSILGASTDAIIPTVNLSIAFSPFYRDIIDTDIVIDVVDVFFQNADNSFLKRFNIGAEIRFIDMFIVRVGLHQGYPTAGAGLAFRYFKINYAYYSEELGAYVGQLRDDRHILELVFRI